MRDQRAAFGPIAIDGDSCLRATRQAECRACEDGCPLAALVWHDRTMTVVEGCVGCGRCAAVCPNDALAVEGFVLGPLPPATPLRIACRRDRDASAGAVQVPCLGGLTATGWLELCDAAERPIEVVDRGWCEACGAGGTAAPWQAQLDAAERLLAAVGWPEPLRPRIRRQPLPLARARPLRAAVPDLSRRALFAGAGAGNAVELAPRRQVRPLRRQRQDGVLARLALRTRATTVPPLPELRVGPACADHGVCAAVCPTGALSHFVADRHSGLGFEPERCLDCGRCAAVCPSAAITVTRAAEPVRGRRTVASHARRACDDCGDDFAASGEDALCPSCRTAAILARAGWLLQTRDQSRNHNEREES